MDKALKLALAGAFRAFSKEIYERAENRAIDAGYGAMHDIATAAAQMADQFTYEASL